MIVLLLFAYPAIGANQLVGTDLTQAVPLTLAAALGALAFGHVEVPVTASIILGSVPAVLVGSLISSRAPDRYIRPVITFVIFASGLKYVGLGTTALAWTLGAILLAARGNRTGLHSCGPKGRSPAAVGGRRQRVAIPIATRPAPAVRPGRRRARRPAARQAGEFPDLRNSTRSRSTNWRTQRLPKAATLAASTSVVRAAVDQPPRPAQTPAR